MRVVHHVICVLVMLLTGAVFIGCGSCPAVQQERDAFAGRQSRKVKKGPHLRLEVSLKRLNETLNRQVKGTGRHELSLPGLGELKRYVGKYDLSLKRLELRLEKRREASLSVQVALKSKGRELLHFRLKAVAPIKIDQKKGTARMSFRGDMFERVQVTPSRGASNSLATHFRSLLPSSVRVFVPQQEVADIASHVIRSLSDRLYREIRNDLLKPIGEFASFKFRMPDVPIEEIGIVTVNDVLAFEVQTSLASDGLPPLRKPKLPAGGARLSVSVDTLAELGNWAMYKGKIPSRYTMKGKPAKDGAFSAGLRWSRGSRPMKVHLFSREGESTLGCMYIRAGASPSVRFSKKKLKVGFKDGKLESLIGPPLVNEVADILGISNRAFSFTKGIAVKQDLKIGRESFAVSLAGAKLTKNIVAFDLKLK